MPNSITIVSPVSGETIPASAVMNVSVDYEYVYTTPRYIGSNCSTGGGHSGSAGPIATGDDSAEVGLGTHSTSYTGVEVTARIMDSTAWNSPYVAQATVNNITITADPVIRFDAIGDGAKSPYFRLGKKTAADAEVQARWLVEYGKPINKDGAGFDEVKLDREFDEKMPPKLTGTVKKVEQYLKGKIIGAVYGKQGKTGLVLVYTLKDTDVILDAVNGTWEVILPAGALKATKPPRQIILTFFDKDGAFVATISASLRKKA